MSFHNNIYCWYHNYMNSCTVSICHFIKLVYIVLGQILYKGEISICDGNIYFIQRLLDGETFLSSPVRKNR